MRILFKAILVLWTITLFAQSGTVYAAMPDEGGISSSGQVYSRLSQIPLHFVANQGQADETVAYYARSENAFVYCTYQGVIFQFPGGSVSLELHGGSHMRPQARAELPGKVNYFIGNDPSSWRTDIPTFREVVYRSIYPGINLVYSGNQQRLKYTFYVQPGAAPDQIQMMYEGVESIRVDEETGEAVIQTEWGEIRDAAPEAYQEIEGIRRNIDISFRLIGENRFGFALGDYDAEHILVLDPVVDLVYSTYLGGNGAEDGIGIAVDGAGNAYITGRTWSSDFPIRNPLPGIFLPGSYIYSAFVTKIDTTKSGNESLIYSTYLGGSNDDTGAAIAVDGKGNAYIAGPTISDDFPTKNPYQVSYGGDGDIFVTKLSSAGNQLVYSTYLGGSNAEIGSGIALDKSGNAYVSGTIFYPTPPGSEEGDTDVLVAKLSYPLGAVAVSLEYLIYLGGAGADEGARIAVDGSGNAYVTGSTRSDDFPATPGAYQVGLAGDDYSDAFVAKLNSSGGTIYCTYLGGTSWDFGYGIAVDSSGNAYVTGYTAEYDYTPSANFPIRNAYQSSFGGGDTDAFVTRLSTDGSDLVYSTFLGGNSDDYGFGIAADSEGSAYVTGIAGAGFPTTAGAYQENNAGWSDAFVSKFPSTGRRLLYSTFLGGEEVDSGADIAVDSSGNAYIAGSTSSDADFPTTPNAYQPTRDFKYYWDAFMSKLEIKPPPGMSIEVFSPVALTVTDPLGRIIDQITSEIPSASYELVDLNGDGELDVRVNIPDALLGNYLIGLIPNPGASPTDTYTLDVIFGNQLVTLAENVQLQYMPTEPYTFFFPVLGMKQGWNLISLPLQPPDTDPAAVLASLGTKYDYVWAYHPDNGWSIYAPWAPTDLEAMEPNWGYWVKMNESGDLLVEGTDPTETTIPLYGEKWNLVGYSSREYRSAEDCMSQVADKINSVWAYDPDTVWDIYVPGGPSDLEVMGPGVGYWIKADQYCEWDVNAIDQSPAPPLAVRKKRTSEDAPGIPYMIWGDVEVDGMKITGKEADYPSLMAILRVDGVVEATCKLGTSGSYGRFYRLYVPMNIDDSAQAEIYFQVDDNLVKAAPVPPGRPGQVIRFDVTVRVPPKVSVLHQNYPNPFNPDTWIPYQLSDDADVLVKIYTSAGRLVRMLNLGHKPAGFYADKGKAAYWDGKNEAGEHVASGVYFYTIKAGDFTDTRKMVIMR
jgi:hypothetical protein